MAVIPSNIIETIDMTHNGQYNITRYSLANVDVQPDFEELEITPSASSQTFTPSTDAYSSVNISAVDSTIDENILPENIKGGVEILGVTGEYIGDSPSKAIINTQTGKLEQLTQIPKDMFANVKTIGYSGLAYGFYKSTNLEGDVYFPELTLIENKGLYYTFYDCNNLQGAYFPKLETINGSSSTSDAPFYYAFRNTNLTEICFPSLTSIYGKYAFQYTFYGSNMKRMLFPALEVASDAMNFNYMLQNVDGCTVIFPSSLQSLMQNWSTVTNGFRGTNTTVLFADLKNLPINEISSNQTIYANGIDITHRSSDYFIVGTNKIVVKTESSIYSYDFIVDEYTEEFTVEPSISLYQVTLDCEIDSTTYKVEASDSNGKSYKLEADENNQIYVDENWSLNIYPDSNSTDYYVYPQYIDTITSDLTIEFDFIPVYTVTYTPEKLLEEGVFSDPSIEQYFSIDSETNQLLIHIPVNISLKDCSLGVNITEILEDLPNATGEFLITGSARVSSEANYDYGYIIYAPQQPSTVTTNNVKNHTTPSGLDWANYVFGESGEVSKDIVSDIVSVEEEQLILSIGWTQDTTIKGTNTFYVDPIKVIYLLNPSE